MDVYGGIVSSVYNSSRPQYLPPRFIIELGGHFNVPVFQASGHLQDYFTFKDYGLVQGIGFHLNVKYAANKKANIFPYLTFGFCQLQNNDDGLAFIDSNSIQSGYPLPGNTVYHSTPGNSLLAMRIFNLGLGVQYYFSTRHHLLPFAGVEVDYNRIWGFYEQQPYAPTGNGTKEKTTFNFVPASRIGMGIDAGLDYRINDNLGFLCGIKFKLANLFGKSSEKTNPASVASGDLNKLPLLDASATDLNSNLSSSRNITYFEFYLGFSIFVGRR